MEYCSGGDLFYHLCQLRSEPVKYFSEECGKFFAAEVLLALEHLHIHSIVYRDLKPENVMLSGEGHVKLVDFGLARESVEQYFDEPMSPCGSAMYVSPEVLDFMGGFMIDWWSLGVLLYELLTGAPPWNTKDRKELFRQIRSARITYPPQVTTAAQELMKGLLERNPAERLGARNGASDIKCMPFFRGIDWHRILNGDVEPPFKPLKWTQTELGANMDVRVPQRTVNFDRESSAAAMRTLDHVENAQVQRDPEAVIPEPTSFHDFEPVRGFFRRLSSQGSCAQSEKPKSAAMRIDHYRHASSSLNKAALTHSSDR